MRTLLACLVLVGCSRASTPVPTPEGAEGVSLLGAPLRPPPMPEAPVRQALAALAQSPNDPERMLALGAAYATAWRFREAIALYTRGVEQHPGDARFLRFRGHRHLTLRRFAEGAADLDRAAVMDSTNFDVVYHQGLAHYLLGDYGRAADAYGKCLAFADNMELRAKEARGEFRKDYRSCMRIATDPRARVSMTDWAWRSNVRAGRVAAADRLLGTIASGLTVTSNQSYLENLQLYQGRRSADEVLAGAASDSVRFSTSGYAVASWLLLKGDSARGWQLMERVARGPHWNGFGVIAAEVDLSRRR
jgi:tetratricopeptide (TPR) repeat protein